MATEAEWRIFEDEKKLNEEQLRMIKFNLLPEAYKERFDQLEEDWLEMQASKFLLEAQKIKQADKRASEAKAAKDKKSKQESSSRKRRDHNDRKKSGDKDEPSNKRSRRNGGFGKDRDCYSSKANKQCELCKAAGAPEVVYKSHYTNQCNKAQEYAKKLKAKSNDGKREYRKVELTPEEVADLPDDELALIQRGRYLEKQILKKRASKKKGKKAKKRGDSGSVSSMSVDSDF